MFNDSEENEEDAYAEEDYEEDVCEEESGNEKEDDLESLYIVQVAAPDGYVNFREGARTDYDIICEIYNGEQVSVYEDAGDWLNIEYADEWGDCCVTSGTN